MNFLDVPYLIEFFFATSTVVFLATLYVILPALLFNKRTVFKPTLITALWRKVFKNIIELINIAPQENKSNKIFLVVEND